MNAATFTIGAEAANARNVLVELKTANTRGATLHDVSAKEVVDLYLSSDAAGDMIVNAAGTGIVPTAGVDGSLIDTAIASTKASWKMRSEADGDLNVVLTNAGDENETVYLNVVLASGKVVTSGAIAFVDDTP